MCLNPYNAHISLYKQIVFLQFEIFINGLISMFTSFEYLFFKICNSSSAGSTTHVPALKVIFAEMMNANRVHTIYAQRIFSDMSLVDSLLSLLHMLDYDFSRVYIFSVIYINYESSMIVLIHHYYTWLAIKYDCHTCAIFTSKLIYNCVFV